MDATEEIIENSKRNEREEDSFSDEDEAVHSVRFKRKKANDASGNVKSGGAAGAGGSSAGRGSGLYLDTIQRYMLDFDFEKVCSVSLSNLNVYACLVCGKYFQGTKQGRCFFLYRTYRSKSKRIERMLARVVLDD